MGSSETVYLLSYADSEDSVDLSTSTSTMDLLVVKQQKDSLSLAIAAELAVELINNRTDILPGYTLELLKREGGCTMFNYVSFFQDLLYSNKKIVGIVGPGCTESSYAVGFQIAKSNLSMMSVGLSSTLQTEILTNSFSLLNPIDYARALLKMIEKNGWTRLLVVYDITAKYHAEIFNYFLTNLPESLKKELDYQPLHNSTLNSDPRGWPENDRECIDDPRVFIIIAGSNFATGILCWFLTVGFSYPVHQFVLVGHTLDDVVESAFFCNKTLLSDGTIFLHHNLNSSAFTTISGLSYVQFTDKYNSRMEKSNQKWHNSSSLHASFYGALYFDAVWAQVLALNATMGNGFNLSDYHYGYTDFADRIRKNLFLLDFHGISGRIRFNKSTRFVDRVVDIYQVRNSSMKRLEYYNSLENKIHAYESESIDYVYSKFKSVFDRMILGIISFVLFTFLTFALIALQTVTLVYKNHPSIKATSPKVRHLSYIGCYFIIFGCIVKTVGNCFHFPNTTNQCLIDHWAEFFIGIGSILVIATLTTISYRMYRIFVHYMHPGRFVQDSWLIGFVLVTTGLYMVCTIFGYALARPETIIKCIGINKDEMTIRFVCENRFGVYKLPWLFFPVCLTVLACVFSLLSNSKVTIKEFKTTSVTILSSIYFLVIIIWTLFYFLKLPYTPEFEVIFVTNVILICSCTILLYLPPTWLIFKRWYEGHHNNYNTNHAQSCPTSPNSVYLTPMSTLK